MCKIMNFQLEEINVRYSDEPDAAEKMREECCPGQPYISFFTKPGVNITCVNPEPHSGLFTRVLKISSGDTVTNLSARIVKDTKAIKGENYTV